jgi:hypothetical protein
LAFPSENTLRTKYATCISQSQDDLTDLTRIGKEMTYSIAHYAPFPELLLRTLCIDVFTANPNSPRPRRLVSDIQGVGEKTANGGDSEINASFFLIQLTPRDRKFRVIPLHLMTTAKGTASPTIRRFLDEAIEKAISADNRVRILFVSVDGDEGYTSYFNECFAS